MAARYVVDEEGRRVGVLLDVEEYERMLEELEDADDIRAYDEAMEDLARGKDELIPWKQAMKEIDEGRVEG